MARSSIRPAARGSRHGAGAEGSPANICLLSNGRYTVMLDPGRERIQHL